MNVRVQTSRAAHDVRIVELAPSHAGEIGHFYMPAFFRRDGVGEIEDFFPMRQDKSLRVWNL